MRRSALLALALVLALATPAWAHGGVQVISARDGAYAVTVRAAAAQGGVDLTTYLVRQDLGEPDLAARVTLTLDTPQGVKTVTPEVVGDGYETIVPGKPDAWRDWTIQADVRGAAGTASVQAEPIGEDGAIPGWVLPAGAVVVLALGVWAVRRRADLDRVQQADQHGVPA